MIRRFSINFAILSMALDAFWVALGFFDLVLYKTDIEDFVGIPMLELRAPRNPGIHHGHSQRPK